MDMVGEQYIFNQCYTVKNNIVLIHMFSPSFTHSKIHTTQYIYTQHHVLGQWGMGELDQTKNVRLMTHLGCRYPNKHQ